MDKKKLALLAVSGEEDEPLMLTNPNIVGLLERTWKVRHSTNIFFFLDFSWQMFYYFIFLSFEYCRIGN